MLYQNNYLKMPKTVCATDSKGQFQNGSICLCEDVTSSLWLKLTGHMSLCSKGFRSADLLPGMEGLVLLPAVEADATQLPSDRPRKGACEFGIMPEIGSDYY